MKIVLQNVFWLLIFSAYNYLCLAGTEITIGAILNEDQHPESVNWDILRQIDQFATEDEEASVTYAEEPIVKIISAGDTFGTTKELCSMAETGVSAVFGPQSPTASAAIESMCGHMGIPYIITSWQPPVSSARSSMEQDSPQTTAFNLFPKAEAFSQGLAAIVKSLEWKQFAILYETEEGLMRLQDILKLQVYDKENSNFRIFVRKLQQGDDHRILLKEIRNSSINRIVLDCKTENILNILEQGKEVKLVDFSTSFFLTALDAHTVDFSVLQANINITTIRLFNNTHEDFQRIVFDSYTDTVPEQITTEAALLHDAMVFLSYAIKNAVKDNEENENPVNLSSAKISCKTDVYQGGLAIVDKMKSVSENMNEILGSQLLSGPRIQLDDEGKRSKFTLYVYELDRKFKLVPVAEWKPISEDDKDTECPELRIQTPDQKNRDCPEMKVYRNASEILQQVRERIKNYKFIVTSRLGRPYLWVKNNSNELQGNDRYYGYSLDLITEIAKILNFTFEFTITKQNAYSNLMEDLIQRRADLAICDLTITHQRRELIDFSMPFMSLGISILHKKDSDLEEDSDTLYAFLRPFSMTVWIYTGTLFLIVSVIIFFISRMSPDDWENPHPCDQNPEELENIWGIKNSLWLTMGSIMTQGCDILPKGVFSRMATAMWWFFSLIMTSSYTANLAAFLTMQKMDTSIDSVEELANQNKIKYGVIDGGSTMAFFRDSNNTLYQKMWSAMTAAKPSVFEKENAKGVERVNSTKNALYAFIMESTGIEYEVETKCNLRKIGNWLDSKSYGIGMPLNADYRSEISRAVLKLQEAGKLNMLKEKWWKIERDEPRCEGQAEESETSELALANVGGVFLVLGVGIALAFFLAIIEFLWNVYNVSVEEHLPYWETLKAEMKFACNVWVTRKRTKTVISESSSSKSSISIGDKSMARSILHGASSFLNVNTSVIQRIGSKPNLSNPRDS